MQDHENNYKCYWQMTFSYTAILKHLRMGLTNWEQKGNYQFTKENISNMGDWKHYYQINCA